MLKAKFTKKLFISASVATATAMLFAGCMGSGPAKEPEIAGGVKYPLEFDKKRTGPYAINPQAYGLKANHGREPTDNELKAWDKDVMADGTGLPEGEGSVEDGEAIYEAQCVMCHGDFGAGGGGYPALSKGNAEELKETMTNNRWVDPEADGPVRVFGSYWPVASTMWWYIRDAMPHTKSKTLTDDETYALTAYMLYINEMSVDGVEVDEEYVLNKEKFLKIVMPNRDGFVPKISGPDGLENVRKFYKNPENFGAVKVAESDRCMTNCQTTDNVMRIKGAGISDFHPPMSAERGLPGQSGSKAHKVSFDAKAAYQENCTACHGMIDTAPAAGDKSGWRSFLKKKGGKKGVIRRGLAGTEMGMPAKGGSSLTDAEFKKVVEYMLK